MIKSNKRNKTTISCDEISMKTNYLTNRNTFNLFIISHYFILFFDFAYIVLYKFPFFYINF